ncbi:MAG TPA: hypothetical protein VGM90_13900 [Kofleriaceae bacterium]
MRLYWSLLLLIGCGGSSSMPGDGNVADDSSVDAAPIVVDDGAPTRITCKPQNQLGSALTTSYGRLDGILVAIVPPGGGGCQADNNHLHLQIRMNNQVYDVAVNVGDETGVEDVHSTTREIAMPGIPWQEGWHTAVSANYPTLGVVATDLPLRTTAELVGDLMNDLSSANHISVFATGYGSDGAHLVHRNGNSRDGLIVTEPLSRPAHVRMFSFTGQAF